MKISLRTPRYGKTMVAKYLSEFAEVLAYSKIPLRSEKAIKELYESRKSYVKRGAHHDGRSVSVYKVIRQKIKSFRRFITGQDQRHQSGFYESMIDVTEKFLEQLYAQAKLHQVERDPAREYQRSMERMRRRASRRNKTTKHLKLVRAG